jgi:hypothetical protein
MAQFVVEGGRPQANLERAVDAVRQAATRGAGWWCCPVRVDLAWLAWHGGAAVKMARAVYDERQLPSGHPEAARLAVLADMLEEAGCADPHLLGHLRGPEPHVRGCRAVDRQPYTRGIYAPSATATT